MRLYIDACIVITLWQMGRGWDVIQEFFDAVLASGTPLFVSGMLFKELQNVLSSVEHKELVNALSTEYFSWVFSNDKVYAQARAFEREANYAISFGDCMHLALAIHADAMLVTLDKKLIAFAETRWRVMTPKQILETY